MMNGKCKGLFVTDLDGTLLTDAKTFSAKDVEALHFLQTQGYTTVIATGRSKYSFCSLMKGLGGNGAMNQLPMDYVVFSTGAGLMEYPGETILESISLQEEEVAAIVNFLEPLGCDYMVHKPVPDTHHFLYRLHGRENGDFRRRLDIYSDYATPLPPDGLADGGEATEVLCIVEKGAGENLVKVLQDQFPMCSVILATSPLDGISEWVEIFAKPVSKSQSIARLCNRLELSPQKSCSIGNDYNDEDLLQWTAHSYLVENGPDRLKELFPVVASNNAGGVSEAIDSWLKIVGQ